MEFRTPFFWWKSSVILYTGNVVVHNTSNFPRCHKTVHLFMDENTSVRNIITR